MSSATASLASYRHEPSSYSSFASSSLSSPYGLPINETCVSDVLRHHAAGFTLSNQSLDDLDRIKHDTTYPEGCVVFVEGQTPRGVYVLCQGRAKLMTTNRDGKTFIMKIAEPGEILGLHAVMTGRPYELTVELLQPSQLAFISTADFLRFIRQHADACLYMAQQLSNDCQSAYEVIRSIGLSHSVSEKLARLLLQWSVDGEASNGSVRLKMTLTHEEVAQLIGTTRETVTRTLGELKKRKVLEVKGATMLIRNKPALEALLEA